MMTKLEQDLIQALEGLLDAVAGEQRDPQELERALGKQAPIAIEYADVVLKRACSVRSHRSGFITSPRFLIKSDNIK